MASGGDIDRVEQVERSRVRVSEVSWALRDLTRASAQANHALGRRMGLRPTDFAAVDHVFTHSGPVKAGDLSARLGITTGSTTELIDRLERAGHLHRHRSDDDRRQVTLQLDPSTVQLVLGYLAPLFERLDAIAGDYSEAEQELIADYLRRAADAMHEYGRGD